MSVRRRASAQTPCEPEFHFELTRARRCQTAEPVECGGAAWEVTWGLWDFQVSRTRLAFSLGQSDPGFEKY